MNGLLSAGWPAAGSESREWRSTLQSAGSGILRLYEGPYPAAVAAPIALARLDLPLVTMVEVGAAAERIAGLLVEIRHRSPAMRVVLETVEIVASLRLAGVVTSVGQVAAAQIGRTADASALHAVDAASALRWVRGVKRPMTSVAIRETHRLMTARLHPNGAGAWRSRQVWIGGSTFGPHHAAYIPPHHDRLPDPLDDLRRFASRTDLPALAHAALADAQFQTIHPFVEANGRTGRALVHGMLARSGLAGDAVLPLSIGLGADVDRYVTSLEAYRAGDPVPIVSTFADAALLAAERARRLIVDLEELRKRWTTRLRSRRDSRVWPLIDLLMARPAIDAQAVARGLNTTVQNAMRAIQPLVDAGVLSESTGHARNRLWFAAEVSTAVEQCSQSGTG